MEDLFRDGGGTSVVPELHSQSEPPDHQGHQYLEADPRSVAVAAEDLFQGGGGPPVWWRSTPPAQADALGGQRQQIDTMRER